MLRFLYLTFFLFNSSFFCSKGKKSVNTKTGQLYSFIVPTMIDLYVSVRQKLLKNGHHTTQRMWTHYARLQFRSYWIRKLFIMESMLLHVIWMERSIKIAFQLDRKTRFRLSTHHGNSRITDFHLTLYVSTKSQIGVHTTREPWLQEMMNKKREKRRWNYIVKQQHRHRGTHTIDVTWLGLFNTHSCVVAVFSHLLSSYMLLFSRYTHYRQKYSYPLKMLAFTLLQIYINSFLHFSFSGFGTVHTEYIVHLLELYFSHVSVTMNME